MLDLTWEMKNIDWLLSRFCVFQFEALGRSLTRMFYLFLLLTHLSFCVRDHSSNLHYLHRENRWKGRRWRKEQKVKRLLPKIKDDKTTLLMAFFMYFLFNYTFHHDYVHTPIALIFIFLIFYLAQDSTRLIDC